MAINQDLTRTDRKKQLCPHGVLGKTACRICQCAMKAASQRLRYWADPIRHRKYQTDWNAKNHDKVVARRRELHEENPGQRRISAMKRLYGLDETAYQNLLLAQNNLCPICGNGLDSRAVVDHDHTTGAVRGIVHITCNTAMGMLGDDVNLLCRAAEYLSRRVVAWQ